MLNLNRIDTDEVSKFVHELVDYYSEIDDNFTKVIYEMGEQADRDNAGWYHYKDGKHYINLNIPNIMNLEHSVKRGSIDVEGFYAFVTIIVGHVYRHFMQTRHNKDGIEVSGYYKEDIFRDEILIYIKMFFDEYYLRNWGFLKPEIDADKFAIKYGWGYLTYFPEINVDGAISQAINHYAYLLHQRGMISTVPFGCESLDEVIERMNIRSILNMRFDDLEKTLVTSNPKCLAVQKHFALSRKKVLADNLPLEYRTYKDCYKQDLLVAKRILENISNPEESLQGFPEMRKRLYIGE